MMTNDLRTAALAAYEEQQAVERERRVEKAQSVERAAKARFRSVFGAEPDSVETTRDWRTMVYAGGMAFEWYDRCLHLYGKCPRCGQDCMGQIIGNPYMLGEALTDGFTPNYTHSCPGADAPEAAGSHAPDFWIDAIGLIDLASGREGPESQRDAAMLGQLYALIAIGQELRRMNDRNDRQDDHQDARE